MEHEVTGSEVTASDKPSVVFDKRDAESPSVRVRRHTQNRRRYSLNASSQGGGPEPRKKQSDGSRNWGQIHSGEWRPAIIQASGSTYLSLSHKKLSLMKKDDHVSAAFVWP